MNNRLLFSFFFIFVLLIELNNSIKVLNSTISKKDVNLFGNQLNYAVFEINFDSDIYKYDSLACPNFNCTDSAINNNNIDCSCDYTDINKCPKDRDLSCTNSCPLVDDLGAELCDKSKEWIVIEKDIEYEFKSNQTIYLRYKADATICEGVMIQNHQIKGFYKLAMGRSPDYLTQRDMIYGNPLVYGVMNICPTDNSQYLVNQKRNQAWTHDTFYLTILPFTSGVEFKMSLKLTSKPVPHEAAIQPSPCPIVGFSNDPELINHRCLVDGEVFEKVEQNNQVDNYYIFKAEKSAIYTIRCPTLYEPVTLFADDKQKKPQYLSNFNPPKWASKDSYENSIVLYLEKDSIIYINAYVYWATFYQISITSQAYYSPVNISSLPSMASMFALVKSSRIVNPITTISCEQWSQCFLYTIGAPYTNNDPVSPLPPTYLGYFIQDSLPSYYELDYDDTLLNPIQPKTFQAAFLMSYKIGSSTTSTLVSWELVKNSKIEFLSNFFDQDGNPISSTIKYSESEYQCDYKEFNEILLEIDRIEQLLYNVTDLKEMNNYRYQLDTLTVRDSYIGCSNKAKTYLDKQSIKKNVTGTFCDYSTNDPRFETDPCCTVAIRYKQCCNPIQKEVVVSDYVGIVSKEIKDQCLNPDCTETVVDQYFNSLNVQDECSIPKNALDEIKYGIITILRQCQNDFVINIPSCSFDSDCQNFSGPNAKCDIFTRKCIPDYQFIDKRYLNCIFSQIDQSTLFKLFNKPFILNDTVIEQLYQYYQKEDCINHGTSITQTPPLRQSFLYTSDQQPLNQFYSSPYCLDSSCTLVHDINYDDTYGGFYKDYFWNDFSECELYGFCNSDPFNCNGNPNQNQDIELCKNDCDNSPSFCGYCSNNTESLCIIFDNQNILSENQCLNQDFCLYENNQFVNNLSNEQCESNGYCSVPCGYECTGYNGCIYTNISDSSTCLSLSTVDITTQWDTDNYACVIQNIQSQDTCSAISSSNISWINCQDKSLDECSGPTFESNKVCTLKPIQCQTEEECLQAGKCSDSYFFLPENTRNYNLNQGKCIREPELYRSIVSCYFSFDQYELERDSPMGCFNDIPMVFTREECENLDGYKWWAPALTKDQCLTIEGCKTFPPDYSSMLPYNTQFNQMNKEDCLGCYQSNNNWTNKFEWEQGKWFKGISTKGQWIQSKWTQINHLTVSLDYERIYQSLMYSANSQMSDLLRSEYFCRSFRIKNNLDSISCSCSSSDNDGSKCFKDSSLLLGQSKPCNGKSNEFEFDYGKLIFSKLSVEQGCGNILISQFPYQLFASNSEQQAFPSNFVSYPKPEKYGITNKKDATIGTILGDGISIESQGINSLTICFKLNSFGNQDKYPILDLASRNPQDQKLYPLNLKNISISNLDNSNTLICSEISNIEQKENYFPINRIENYIDQSKSYFDKSTEGLLYTLAVLFLLVSVYGLYQLLIIIIIRLKGIIVKFELVHLLIFMIFIFVTVRMVYFFLLPKGYLADSAIADYSLVVLPTFFYFSCFTIIIVLWYVIVFLVLKQNSSASNLTKRVTTMLISVNIVIYLLLIVIIIVFQYTKNQYHNNCGNRILVEIENSNSQKAVSIIYAVVQAAISFVIATAFIYLGGSLYSAMTKALSNNSNHRAIKKTKKIFLLTTICSTGFIIHCIFIIVLVAIKNPSIIFSFVGLVISEIIPSIIILYTYDQRVSLSLDKTLSVKTSTSNSSSSNDTKLSTKTFTNEKTFSENLSSEF